MKGEEGKDVAASPRRPSREPPGGILDRLQEGFQVVDPDYRYLYVNDAVVRQGKSTREALLGRTMMECYPGIDKTPMFEVLSNCMEQRVAATMENEFTFPDGSQGWFELRFEPVPEGVVILSVDVTQRKGAELELKDTVRALTTLSRCNQALIRATEEQPFLQEVCDILVDAGGYAAARLELLGKRPEQVAAVTCAGPRALEPREAMGASFQIVCGPSLLGRLSVYSPAPESMREEERALLQEVALDVGYGIETLRGRTAHAQMEEQFIAAQRLEAVGRLAGGVAHDFNNLLSVILSYTDFIAEGLPTDHAAVPDVDEIRQAAKSAASLTQRLLAFSRKQLIAPQVTILNDVVRGVEGMLRRLLGEDIEILVRCSEDAGNVLADPSQLEQVLMNLAVNARDAMPNGGKLTIETESVELDEEYSDAHVSVAPGRYVRMSVSDTGVGMAADVRRKIFEPFFTTKEQGKGTGLGMAVVYGIVKQSGGEIWVYSEPGLGTTFKIYFPQVQAHSVSRRPRRAPIVATGNELILLVEDETAVRKAARRALESAGYRVAAATSGNHALALGRKHGSGVALLLTDVVMPGMSGRDIADQLQRENPGLCVLFMSGYTDDAIVHHGVLEPGTHFISKPIVPAELARKVREVLDGG